MKKEKPYRDFSYFLAQHFPYKVQKISINAGFTCPNRDGSKGRGGCTYCNNQSFSPEYEKQTKTISQQLAQGIRFFAHKYPQMHYLAYFQSYTNTYEELNKLTAKYEEALAFPGVKGLVISTRSDCMPDNLLDYLAIIRRNRFVLVEYGVESTLNSTLHRINRLHTFEESEEAIRKTAAHGIHTGAHLILGLPGETREEILQHATTLSKLPLTTVKLHQLQIIRGTQLAKEYRENPTILQIEDVNRYIDLCVDFAERLNPEFYIERFASQSPKEWLIAPDWGMKNHVLTDKIKKRFIERNTFQGKCFTDE